MRKLRKANLQNADLTKYSGLVELEATEDGLIRYSTAIVRKFVKHLDLNVFGVVCDFGAGTGFLARIFRDSFGLTPICVELDPNLFKRLKEEFICVERLEQIDVKFDAIYTSNVLEHIEYDDKALVELRDKLVVGGRLGIYVPAHQFLYSDLDRQVGHFRRYSKSELLDKVLLAGFEVDYIRYDDFLGFFASSLLKLVGYSRRGLGSSRSLWVYDNAIYPISAVLDKVGFNRLLGKNIILICTKPSIGLETQGN